MLDRARRRRGTVFGSLLAALVLTVAGIPAVTASAAPAAHPKAPAGARSALGNGLGRLVADQGRRGKPTGGLRIDQSALSIRDAAGRVLVDVTPQAGANRAAFRRAAEAKGLRVTAVDRTTGTLEGFVSVDAVRRVAGVDHLGTMAQAVKPRTSTGAVESQGVPFQRVDTVQAKGVTGKGITVGALSDSYDTATETVAGEPLTVHAADDVASGDLPGDVTVLEDAPGADEGRAMLQIVHDVAPDAKLCFATAFSGEVGFANNIRALGDPGGACKADVVVDDVTYFDEPFFADGFLSDAIDDVAAQGVHYYSSAGNSGDDNGWSSKLDLIQAKKAVRGTNLDLSDVDPALYDGGLQDAEPGSGTDVAQTVRLGPDGGLVDLQWDDPTDYDGSKLGPSIFSAAGSLDAAGDTRDFTFTPTPAQVGTLAQFVADGVPSGSTDLVLTVTAPDGSVLGPADSGSSPETVSTRLKAGAYTITVGGFDATTGPFTVDVFPILTPSRVTTDLNVLFFSPTGAFLGALADANQLSGRPLEIAGIAGLPEVQMVISRSGTGKTPVTRVRAVADGDFFFSEYGDPLSPTVFGHATAAGATGVAAVDPFRPYLPEFFTSPGGDLPILFDSSGNRYAKPQIRRSPLVAATDGGNTTFFVSDSLEDADALPNFFGTSAAAPPPPRLAARGVGPAARRRLLSRSTFTHDLDPYESSGKAGGLTVSASGAPGYEADPVPTGSQTDPRFFRVAYDGGVPLKSITLFGETASPTALGSGKDSAGIVFDPRPFRTPEGDGTFRDVGFPFTVGATSDGLAKSSVKATFSERGGAEKGQFRHLTLTFASGLRSGQALRFGVDRDLAKSPYGGSNEGNSADELGGGVFAPQRTVVRDGLKFVAKRTDGTTITGTIRNDLGSGYSPLDGYGLIDAQQAVLGN